MKRLALWWHRFIAEERSRALRMNRLSIRGGHIVSNLGEHLRSPEGKAQLEAFAKIRAASTVGDGRSD